MTSEDAARIHAPVASLPTGRYCYDASDERWTLAGITRDILGLGAGTAIDVSTLVELVADDERTQVARFVLDAIEDRVPFSTVLHVVRPHGPREVLVVGEGTYDGERLAAVHGHVVDLGALGAEYRNERIDREVAEVVANRATIEQAKGALSMAYGFDEDSAIALLRRWSSHRNVKVTLLADRLVAALGAGALTGPQLRAAVEALLASVTAQDTRMDGVVD
jgi:hypothetical protein